jgi:peptide/nickel transport system permease protein
LFVAQLSKSKVTVVGLGMITFFILVGLSAPWIAPYDHLAQDVFHANLEPFRQGHIFGTDQFGRDVFSRIIFGTRVSLLLGIASPLVAGLLGTLTGAIAGFFGGWLDRVIMRITDMLMSFPTVLMGVMVAAALGPGFRNVIIAISVALFPRFVRLARASSLSVRREPYIDASVAAGQTSLVILFKHVLPNISGPIVVMSTLWVATAIRLEATLSFLGLGTQPPSPSWGNMIRDGMNNLLGSPWPTILAGLCIMAAVLAFNMVGDAIRDALDPETQI